MFAQTLYEDLPDVLVNTVEPVLWWIAVLLCVGIAIFFFDHYRKAEAGKPFSMGLLVFILFFAIARAIENFRKFYMADHQINIGRWWAGIGPALVGTELVLRVLYYIFTWTAIAIFYHSTEKYVFQNKTKFLFMYSAIAEGIVSIALYFTTGSIQHFVLVFAVIGFFFCGVAPIILYLLMAIKSTGIIRSSAFFATIGLTFFVVGVMAELPESHIVVYLVTGVFLDAWLVALVAPICMIVGLTLMLIGYRKMFSGLY